MANKRQMCDNSLENKLMSAVREWLVSCVARGPSLPPDRYVYRSIEGFVLRHGQRYEPQSLPSAYEFGYPKTEAIYRRYAIQDEAMLREGAAKLDAWNAEQKAKAAAERRGQLRRFKRRAVGQ
jgi:hypothetical protein